jgi:hypothetical protein
MNMMFAYVANQVNEPWLILMIVGLAVGLMASVLWNAFEPREQRRRYDRRRPERRHRRTASVSGRFS